MYFVEYNENRLFEYDRACVRSQKQKHTCNR